MSQDPGGEVQPAVAGQSVGSDEVASGSEDVSPIQPMEQEAADDAAAVCPQPSPVEMESPAAAAATVSSERDQPEGDRCSSSDSIPSLAAALMELHELLVSNNRAQSQNRSSSCSPSHPFGQDADRASPEPCPPTPDGTRPTPANAVAAAAEDAKVNHAAAAAASEEEPSQCLVPEAAESDAPPPCPDSSMDTRPDKCLQGEASDAGTSQSDPASGPESRQPPEGEGQHSRGVADGRASGGDAEDSTQTESGGASREDAPSTSPSSRSQAPQPSSPAPPLPLPPPHPFSEQFPAEHIQRIQAAGFSAREAVEALERAHGVVELALLALLARSITVPT